MSIGLYSTVRKEITAGVLLAGLFLSCMVWFVAYNQEKAQAFTAFSIYTSGVIEE